MKQSDVRLLPHQSQTLDNSQLSAVMEDVMSETVFYKLLIDKNIWFVVSQNVRLIKCSAGMACSLISLRATDTTMERGIFLSYFDHFANELLPNPSFTLKIGSHRGLKCIEKILSEW